MDCSDTVEDRDTNPRKNANFLSVITFFYNYQTLKKGRKQKLEENDIFKVLPEFEAEKLGDKLEKQWKKDTENNKKLWRTLMESFGSTYCLYSISQLFVATFVMLYQPKILSIFVTYFGNYPKTVTKFDAYLYSGALGGILLLNVFFTQNLALLLAEYSLKVRTAVSSLIFRKALRISLAETTIGKIITLITKDVFAIDAALNFFKDVFIGFLQLAVITYILYDRMGIAGLFPTAVIILIIPIQLLCGTIASNVRLQTNEKTDERFRLSQEVFSAAKTIKINNWQGYFEGLINRVRLLEINKLAQIYYLKAIISWMSEFAIYISFFVFLYYHMATDEALDAETMFFVQNCLFMMKTTVTFSIPMGISNTADLLASFKRIQSFLELEEVHDQVFTETKRPNIRLNNVKVVINQQEVLKSVSLELSNGLLLVTGSVRSGKTILLKTILKEYPVKSGQLEVDGKVSYAPQEPWIFPSTIRQNILFGEPYNAERYREISRICAINDDQRLINDNLSNGQKARISLARAVYRESDIYLLDDCLAVLDSKLAASIFKHCIQGFLKDKICIFATNKMYSGHTILHLENGCTLNLAQQNRGLDKRITYFIDEEIDLQKPRQSTISQNIDLMYDSTNESDELISTINNNIYKEEKNSGSVSWSNYASFYKLMGGFLGFLYLIIAFGTAQAALLYFEKLTVEWINTQIDITYHQKQRLTNSTEYRNLLDTRNYCFKFYLILLLPAMVVAIVRSYSTFHACLDAARALHNQLITSLLKTSFKFFDDHFIGNIINRLSKDLYVLDEYMPFLIFDVFRIIVTVIGALIMVASVNWMLFIPGVLLLVKFYFLQRIYLPTGRSLRRLEASSRSPIIGYLNSALEGLIIIRSSRQNQKLISEFDRHQDFYTSAYHMNQTTTRLFAFLFELFSSFFVMGICMKLLLFFGGSSAGDISLIVIQSMLLSQTLQYAIRQFTELEIAMTSTERILEYSNAASEKSTEKFVAHWPSNGKIQFHNVSLTNNEAGLNNIYLEIDGGEKVGIIGKSGTGKTSFVSTLLRLHDYQGKISIDNEDINLLSLDCLRSRITLIPQDPKLFSGSIRTNIDPLLEFTDEDIWKALEDVRMKKFVSNLDQPIRDYSVGEKQLLCLARALISQNKILILDAPTSNLDTDMGMFVKKLIESSFKSCTVIMVANESSSLLWCDKVVTLKDGQILETNR
ncbi:unnamed protein product [Ceutorhynchus assimilis]|uniref:Uncharacterized protein n=1 Tax=Ceutorhynchus assimilis TaxID=467358 RepID=A0A9N9MWI2_9CUCU|nr:unnamed protein product [Ceutorhynchus assimilis]